MEFAQRDVFGKFRSALVSDGGGVIVTGGVEIARINQAFVPDLVIMIGRIAVAVRVGIFFPLVDLHHAAENRCVLFDPECGVGKRYVLDDEFTADRHKLSREFGGIVIRRDLHDCLFDLVSGLDVADVVAFVPPEQNRADDDHEKSHKYTREQTAFFVAVHKKPSFLRSRFVAAPT